MSDPIKVGGSWTCEHCGVWEDGSGFHECVAPVLPSPSPEARQLAESIVKEFHTPPFLTDKELVERIVSAIQVQLLQPSPGKEATEVAREIVETVWESREYLISRIAAAIDAARPKVSEDDEKAAEQLIRDWWNREGAPKITDDKPLTGTSASLVAVVAQDRASVRLAERQRIREAVETVARYDLHGDADYISSMQPDDEGDYLLRDDVLTAIDGQPIDEKA